MSTIKGVIVASLTPLDKYGENVDLVLIKDYVDFLYQKGVNGVFVNGTTGEGLLLELDEKKKILYEFKKYSEGKLKIISHCGSLNFSEIKALIQFSKSIDVDAIAVVTPFYYKFSKDEIINFYREVCKQAESLPVFAYNIPGLTNNWVTPDVLKTLKKSFDNFVGVKDSSGSFKHILSLIKTDLDVLVGYDEAFLPSLVMGAKGCVSGPAGVFPEFFVQVWNLFEEGNIKEAQRVQEKLTELSLTIGNGADIPLLKAVMRLRGLKFGGMRFPFSLPDSRKLEKVENELIKLSEKYSFSLKIF
ncbi:dihydrodipicolinate synthase family protein [Thermosipho atlanticus]|uniref:4-hydroxy-tetrahydrodipicolinate synthase n=1 Tax=Thermosipho atlanticus DSM 15807 TaxID=1123380 RepID=A0A1M5TUW8_9BACT|nr:dihydrodipicolinate synthase family protein [Thermosipho atlanticus]SHH54605.1 4-hydroxy-tetrahydrodipicolinate synthase [Thermosipho atlanticus DSM 15807]